MRFLHVKGHQDRDSTAPLDRWAQLNILADHEAKRQLTWYIQNPNHDTDLRYVSPHWSVAIERETVSVNIRHTLRHHVHTQNMKKFLIRKGTIGNAEYHRVDWDSNRRALQSMAFAERTWVTKFVSGFISCAKMMERYGKWETTLCPRCGDCTEDTWHILWCQECYAKSHRHDLTSKVDVWLPENNTHPTLHLLIVTVLQRGDSVSFSSVTTNTYDPKVRLLAQEQDAIGFRNFSTVGLVYAGHKSKMNIFAQMWYALIVRDRAGLRDFFVSFIAGSMLSGKHAMIAFIKKIAKPELSN